MTERRQRWLSLLWPLALLLLFADTFRRTNATRDAGVDAAQCDSLPARATPADLPEYERCLGIDPSNAELLTALGRAYQAQARTPEAEAMYRRALTMDPHDSDLHVLLGELLFARGDRAGARREGEAALRWRPNGLAATRLAARASSGSAGAEQ
jgi:Flp pilus assembly protein TadD